MPSTVHRMFSIGVLSIMLINPSAGDGYAAEPSETLPAGLQREMVPQLVEAIGMLGRGEVEQAVDHYEQMIGRKFRTAEGPFGKDERGSWTKTFAPLGQSKLAFESVDLMGFQKISGQAYKICLVGNGKQGPVLFQCRVYEYADELRLANVRFDMNWERIELLLRTVEIKASRTYAVKVGQTAGGKTSSSRK